MHDEPRPTPRPAAGWHPQPRRRISFACCPLCVEPYFAAAAAALREMNAARRQRLPASGCRTQSTRPRWLILTLLRGCFGGLLLCRPSAPEHVPDGVIPLVAGVFEQRTLNPVLRQRNFCGPWFRPRSGIVDRESIVDRVGVHSREPFGQAH